MPPNSLSILLAGAFLSLRVGGSPVPQCMSHTQECRQAFVTRWTLRPGTSLLPPSFQPPTHQLPQSEAVWSLECGGTRQGVGPWKGSGDPDTGFSGRKIAKGGRRSQGVGAKQPSLLSASSIVLELESPFATYAVERNRERM